MPRSGRGGGGTGGTALRSNYRGRPGLTPCVCVSRLGPSLRSGSGPSALRPPRGLPQRRRQQQWWRQQQRGRAWRHREQLVHAYPRARNPGAWRCRGPGWTPGGEAAPGRQIENQGTEPTLPAPPPTPRPGVGLPGPAPLPAAPARPPAHPAPEASARPPRGSCTCPWAAARAPPRVLRSPPRPAPRAGTVGRRPRNYLKGSGSASFLPFGAQGPENNQVGGVPVVGEEGPRHRNSKRSVNSKFHTLSLVLETVVAAWHTVGHS